MLCGFLSSSFCRLHESGCCLCGTQGAEQSKDVAYGGDADADSDNEQDESEQAPAWFTPEVAAKYDLCFAAHLLLVLAASHMNFRGSQSSSSTS